MSFGFIVEGHMEADIITHLCKGAHVRRLQINGCSFPIRKICDRIAPHIELLRRKKVTRIYIILDREGREDSALNIENQIVQNLIEKGLSCHDVVACCPDRNFESWIAPFIDDNCVLSNTVQRHSEGENGKSIIKQKFRDAGKSYAETVHGVKLFKLVNPNELSKLSESFLRFHRNISGKCWWADGIK